MLLLLVLQPQGVSQPLAPSVDLQAVWFAKHFGKAAPSATEATQACKPAPPALVPAPAPCPVKSSMGKPDVSMQAQAAPTISGPGSSVATAALVQPVRWWRDASATFGAVAEGATAAPSSAPYPGPDGITSSG